MDGTTFLAEVIAALFLAVLVTFFMLRDGSRFVAWVYRHARSDKHERFQRAADAAWSTLGGYLRGAALLGVLEAIVIGSTLFAFGGRLRGPVMILTFVAAFVRIVGAAPAGVVAVLVRSSPAVR